MVAMRRMNEGAIGGVLLAAGAGERFGGAKQLALLDGKPLLQHAVANAVCMTALHPLVVVVGAHADAVLDRVDFGRARAVRCHGWAEGQAGSLRAGLAALGPDVGAALILLGDQPRITPAVTQAVLAARDPQHYDAVRAAYVGVPGHPVLLERRLIERAGELHGDIGFRSLLESAPVRTVECGELGDASDVDTTQELERLQR